MKEYRNQPLKVLLTKSEKEKIVAYAEDRNMTVSEVIRQLCQKIFESEEK